MFMTKKIEFANESYEISYDDVYLDMILDNLGIEPAVSKNYVKRTVVYYSVCPTCAKKAYIKVAEEDGLIYNTIVMSIRKGLDNAIYNGKLKNIDDLLQGSVYDYDYGFTNKEFIAIICDYLQNHGYLNVKHLIDDGI